MNDYAINLTNKCNWNCSYCISDTHNAKDRPLKVILNEMSKVKKGSTFSLCGGEPGMLSEKDMDKIFEKAKEMELLPLDVLTNGLFLKKHCKHLKDVDTVHYHCVESLKDDVIVYEVPENVTLDYTVVITGNEYKLLDKFIEKHKHIFNENNKVSLIPAIIYEEMKKIDYIKVMSKYKNILSDRAKKSYFKTDCNPLGF